MPYLQDIVLRVANLADFPLDLADFNPVNLQNNWSTAYFRYIPANNWFSSPNNWSYSSGILQFF